ncbi:hypothetical protein E7Y32_09845 [Arthrobacter sp. UKPF54-2]|uniref:hypothetical protein n=1 Tax=Arthrobacter sp. UKPF54-2 TaxID=2600159 RepID=UPI0011B1577F|nr:hypothetical protein [Arthrobacter sp. UKPF54-2]QDY90483.1 hypothetical protein E7Y32_09845 [Arthrobacter sp. UKPF54-2]
MAEQSREHEPDPWEEFDRLTPAAQDRVGGYPGGEPLGFGFRTGVRSARVAFGFAVYALVLGSVLVALGAIYFIGHAQWLWLGLMGLIEAGFVLAFLRLVALARNRRGAR